MPGIETSQHLRKIRCCCVSAFLPFPPCYQVVEVAASKVSIIYNINRLLLICHPLKREDSGRCRNVPEDIEIHDCDQGNTLITRGKDIFSSKIRSLPDGLTTGGETLLYSHSAAALFGTLSTFQRNLLPPFMGS